MSCPRCGRTAGPAGTRKVVTNAIDAGRLVRRVASAPRMRCRSCGHVFVDRSLLGEASTTNAVVASAIDLGIGGAARSYGCDEKAVRSLVRRWTTLREGDLADGRPPILGIALARSMGRDRVLVCDADEMTLLDVVPDPGGLGPWISSRPGETRTVLIPVDAAVRRIAGEAIPGAELAVAPSEAARIIVDAARRALEDAATPRRNDAEDPALLSIRDEDLDERRLDEIATFWTATTRTLRRDVLGMLDALRRGPDAFHAAAARAIERTTNAGIGRRLVDLLATWTPHFAAGAGNGIHDLAWERLRTIALAVEDRMGKASFDVLRIVLVFTAETRHGSGPALVDVSAVAATRR